ncbi:MAG: lysozyme inhibitor LprI family protein [Xanthobacteraceae bacterium]|jgi:uncharacterized protein YecT (DUF1311 family)
MRTVALAGLIIVGCGASSAFSQQAPTPLVPNPPDVQEQTLVPRSSEKPSFDCAQAKTAAARLICADGELARLDGELGAAFQKRKGQISAPDQSQFAVAQLAWIRDRNERCALVGKNGATVEQLIAAKPCMMSLMRERIAFLAQTSNARANTAPPPQQPVPEQPRNGVVSNAPKGIVPAIDNALAAALTDCDSQAMEQVKRDDANWTIGPHWPRQFDSLWTQHVNEIEQQRQQCRRYAEAAAAQRAQAARNQERDHERGYEPISVETFVLDSKELAAKAAKVSVSGAYLGQNNIGFVYVDTRAVIMATKYPNLGEQPKVPLLTDNATREFRQRLLACQSNPAAAQVGCPMTILGEVTICTFSNGFGAERTLPCINVEDGR